MNKLFFSLVMLASIHSLNAMDNGKRSLVLAGAATSAIGGTTLANKIMTKGYKQFENANNQEFYQPETRQTAKKNLLLKSAVAGAIRTSSLVASILLGCSAYSGKLPVHNAQTYVSLLAFAAGGSLTDLGNAQDYIYFRATGRRRFSKSYFIGASAIASLGLYGLYTNK